jgi:hypothetical protein
MVRRNIYLSIDTVNCYNFRERESLGPIPPTGKRTNSEW